MKNKIYHRIAVAAMAIAMIACNPGEFGDLNVDPNNTTSPLMSSMLTNAIREIRPLANPTTDGRPSRAGAHYVQYVGNTQYTSDDNYDTEKFSFNSLYDGPLADLAFIIQYNTDEETKAIASASGSNDNQIGVAKILQSFYYLFITSRWGDVPYSEALQSGGEEQVLNPAYDTQQAIFDGIFAELKEGRNLINADPNDAAVTGDILFNGDMDRWVRFSNTIRLIAALRLSDANASQGQTEFNAALNESEGLITADVVYQYLPEANNENGWYTNFRTRDDWSLTDAIVDYMNINSETNPYTGAVGMMDVVRDPRLYAYGNTTVNSVTDPTWPVFAGQPYGLTEAEAGAITIQDINMLGDHMRTQDLGYPLLPVAQVLFSRAEAAQIGWTSEDAQSLYYQAIQSSLEFYGVEDGPDGDGVGGYDDYITNSEVVWTAGREEEQIATQKWVALYLVGYEGWNNWKRTGWPVLQPSPNGILSQTIPVRQAYPDTERDLNGENWQAAIDRQFGGVDGLNDATWLFPRAPMWADGDRN